MEEYTNIMKEIILSPPNKRPIAEETIIKLVDTLSYVSRREQNKLRKKITPDFRNPQNIKERRKKMANVKSESIKQTLVLNEKKNIQMKKIDE